MIDRAAAGRYVLSRRTPQGGYSFYRTPQWGVEEPSTPDTLAALHCLRLLGLAVPDASATAGWLAAQQDDAGGFSTRVIGWAALQALDLLGARPARSPARWVQAWCDAVSTRGSGVEYRGALVDGLHLAELLHPADGLPAGGAALDCRQAVRALTDLLAHSRDASGGWAAPGTDLETTAVALRLAALLGWPHGQAAWADGAADYVRRCEDPVVGFRLTPTAQATSAGALWGGVQCARILGLPVGNLRTVAAALGGLQQADGGLGRRAAAIATLHDTWMGLEAASLLTARV